MPCPQCSTEDLSNHHSDHDNFQTGEQQIIEGLTARVKELVKALEGALVILESMPRPTAGLVSSNVQKAFDKRIAAVRAALGHG